MLITGMRGTNYTGLTSNARDKNGRSLKYGNTVSIDMTGGAKRLATVLPSKQGDGYVDFFVHEYERTITHRCEGRCFYAELFSC